MRISNLHEFNGEHEDTGRTFSEKDVQLISGAELKRFRKIVGASATGFGGAKKEQATMRTYKLQLDFNESSPEEDFFEAVLKDYNVLASAEQGSLFELWATLLLSGFRVYRTAALAKNSYLNNAESLGEYPALMEEASGEKLSGMTVQQFIALFKAVPRRKDFNAENIMLQLQKGLKLSKVTSPNVQDFLNDLAQHLLDTGGWKECFSDKSEVVVKKSLVITRICLEKNFGVKFTHPLEDFVEGDASLESKSTLAFDPSLPVLPYKASSALYTLISLAMSRFHGINQLKKYLKGNCEDEESNKKLKQEIVSYLTDYLISCPTTCDGYSWMFNAGIELLRKFREGKITGKELAHAYGIPEALRPDFIKRLDLIGDLPALHEIDFGLRDFRQQFGAMISSWMTLFVDRLLEIAGVLTHMREELRLPEIFREHSTDTQMLLSSLSLSEGEVNAVLQNFKELRVKTQICVERFLGLTDDFATLDDVETVKSFKEACDRALAIKRSLDNAVDQFKKHKGESELYRLSLVQKLMQCLSSSTDKEGLSKIWSEWDFLKNHPIRRITTYTLGLKNPFSQLKDMQERRKDLLHALAAYLNRLNAVESFRTLHGREVSEDELRSVLNRIVKIVKPRGGSVASCVKSWFVSSQILKETTKDQKQEIFCGSDNWYVPHNANRLLYSGQGTLYVSRYSDEKRRPYALSSKTLEDPLSVLRSLDDLLKTWSLEDQTLGDEDHDTLLRLITVWSMFKAEWLDDELPHENYLDPSLEKLGLAYARPYAILLKCRPRDAVRYTVNALLSELSPLEAKIHNRSFFINAAFKPIFHEVGYIPKERLWKVPPRLLSSLSNQKLADTVRNLMNADGRVDSVELYCTLINLKGEGAILNGGKLDTDCARLLVQAPHDWLCRAPFRHLPEPGADTTRRIEAMGKRVLTVKKGKFALSPVKTNEPFYRLAGPSSIRTFLDQLLTGKSELSDVQIIAVFSSSDGVSLSGFKVDFAMPVSHTVKAVTEQERFTPANIMGIDQGEFGIAFTVMPLDYLQKPLPERRYLSGYVKINSFKALIADVGQYRAHQKPVKFTASNSKLFQIRENVAGDIAGVIAALMYRFKAFPILEREVRNLESGSRALQNVYKQVNAFFLADGVDEHNRRRQDFWYGGNAWKREELSYEFTDKEGSVTSGAVTFRPGFPVKAAYTSRICHVCGRNPYDWLFRAQSNKVTEVKVEEGGRIRLAGGDDLPPVTLRLYKASQEKRPVNARAELNVPVESGTMPLSELKTLFRRNLRRAPRFMNVKDSHQSRYWCLFEDCKMHGREQHADINASYNIAIRFLRSLKKQSSGV